MSHFYADIQGNKGQASRCGTKESGISGHIRGWNIGVVVSIEYDMKNDRDIVRVYKTGGSNHYGESILIAELTDSKPSDTLLGI